MTADVVTEVRRLPVTAVLVAGWYPDPSGAADLRWWTGAAWSEHVASAPVRPDPSPSPRLRLADESGFVEVRSDRLAVTVFTPLRPTRVHTAAVWLIAVLPVLVAAGQYSAAAYSVAAYSTAQYSTAGMAAGDAIPTDGYAVPAIAIAASLILAGLCAVRDRQVLRAAGHSDTASPRWVLLSPVAYLIARSIRVRQETGVRTTAPGFMWVLMTLPAVAVSVGWRGLDWRGLDQLLGI